MTTKRPILPTSADILIPTIAQLVALRPKAFEALNLGQGVYSHIIAGLRAQAELAIARLTDGVVGNTPQLAKGAQLQAFIGSEYELPTNQGATTAIGTCTFDRTASVNPKLAGLIRKGQKLRRDPLPDGTVPFLQADFKVAADTPVALNQTIVTVPIEGARTGSVFNAPQVVGITNPPLTVVDQLFDKLLLPTTYDVGGGSDGFNDADILRYGLAFALGQFGPTDDALSLAALRAGGVRRILVLGNVVYVADPSWASSARWLASTQQAMQGSDSIGYSTRFSVAAVPNFPVSVALTVRLRDASLLSDTSTLDLKIIAAVQTYLDGREDFNVVGVAPIRSVVSRADTRVLRCTSAVISNPDGSPFVMPPVGHAYLTHNAVSISYLPPV